MNAFRRLCCDLAWTTHILPKLITFGERRLTPYDILSQGARPRWAIGPYTLVAPVATTLRRYSLHYAPYHRHSSQCFLTSEPLAMRLSDTMQLSLHVRLGNK